MTASFLVRVPGEPLVEVLLDEAQVSVGRSEENRLPLRDMNVSRHHFQVERLPNHYRLRDMGSRNGTTVNRVLVVDKVLVEGDRIHVGGSELTFRAQASGAAVPLERFRGLGGTRRASRPLPRPEGATKRAEPATRHDSERLRAAEASLTLDDGLVPPPPLEQERWRKLAEVACAVNLEHDIDRLLERILDAVQSLVPAKSSCLVLREGEDGLRVAANRNAPGARVDDDDAPGPRLSRQVCLEAIQKRRPVLTQDAAGDSVLGQFNTVVNLKLRSILCVPFASQEEVLGVVYLDEPQVDLFARDGEVVDLVAAFGDLAGIALANARLLAEVAARERLEGELRIASDIQRNLLPSTPPQVPGLELFGRTKPARFVGGDLFDFFRRSSPRQETLVSVGDVAGKGVGAGLVMSTVRSLLRAYAESLEGTDEILTRINSHLCRDLDAGRFVSLLLLRYDEASGELSFTGAGHEHLVLYRPATDQLELLRAGGVVLGVVPDVRGRLQERTLLLQPGDLVVLYSDGATEAVDPSGDEFGLVRLGEAVRTGPRQPAALVDHLMAVVERFAGGSDVEPHDDLTVVALRKA